MLRRSLTLAGLVLCVWLPGAAIAQTSAFGDGSIAGVVRDARGVPLEGVSVEVSSPALIEGVRPGLTDRRGRYEIRGLRSGLYTVTFAREAYVTVTHGDIEVTGAQLTPVDATMALAVTPHEESVDVTAEMSVLGAQSPTHRMVLSDDLLDTVPTARHPTSMAALVPGVYSSVREVGPGSGPALTTTAIHGGRHDDQRITSSGFSLGALVLQSVSNFVPNPEATEAVVIETAAAGVAVQTGGVHINYIPRSGSNTLRGSLFASRATGRMQGNNLTQTLIDQGASASPERLEHQWDFNPGLGGPILRGRVWFHAAFRRMALRIRTSQFHDRHAFQPDIYTYLPDPNRPGRSVNGLWTDAQVRVTWSMSPRHTFAASYGDQMRCACPAFISPTRTPEAAANDRNPTQRAFQFEWRWPWSSRLLVDAGVQKRVIEHEYAPLTAETSGVDADWFAAAYPQSIGVTVRNGGGITPNDFMFHGPGPAANVSAGGPFTRSRRPAYSYRAALTYQIGRQTLTFGVQDTFGYSEQRAYSITTDPHGRPVRYVFQTWNTPQAVNVFAGTPASPSFVRNDLEHDMGLYAQDQLTWRRLTVEAGVRFDRFRSSYPEQTIPATAFGRPAATLAGGTNLDWRDWTTRLKASYDPGGDGRTAVKMSANKYVQSQSLNGLAISANPLVPGRAIVNNYTRNWRDADGDFVVDCDLTAPLPNGECTNAIGPNLLTTVPTPLTDTAVREGWGLRPFNWEVTLGIDRELWPGVTVGLSYVRRSYDNFFVTYDTACVDPVLRTGCREAGNYRSYDVVVPVDSRLPGGGGYTLTGFVDPDCSGAAATCGAATAAQIAALSPANQIVRVDDLGVTQTERWSGADVSVTLRREGMTLLAGASTGHRSTNQCDLWRQHPGVQGLGRPLAACEVTEPFRTSLKGVASYTLPRFAALPDWLAAALTDVQAAAVVQSLPGNEMSASYDMTNAEHVRRCPSTLADTSCSTLGRFLANQTQPGDTRTISLLLPGTLYDTRHTQLDLQLGKRVRMGRARVGVHLHVYNALNASPVLARDPVLGQSFAPGAYAAAQQPQADGSYNSLWAPTTILQPRFALVATTFDF